MSVESELRRFERLKKEGLLSPEEYEQRRADLLAAPAIVEAVAVAPKRPNPWLLVCGGVILGMVLLFSIAAVLDSQTGSTSQNTEGGNEQAQDTSASASSSSTESVSGAVPAEVQASSCVAITGQQWTSDSMTGAIEGDAVNNCGRTFRVVSLNFNLYDANGALIGNADDSIENLGTGDKWHFKAATLKPEGVARFTLKSVDGYGS